MNTMEGASHALRVLAVKMEKTNQLLDDIMVFIEEVEADEEGETVRQAVCKALMERIIYL